MKTAIKLLLSLILFAPVYGQQTIRDYTFRTSLAGTDAIYVMTNTNVSQYTELSYIASYANGLIDFSPYVPKSTTLTLSGTANQIDVIGGTQNLGANRTWTFSLSNTINTNYVYLDSAVVAGTNSKGGNEGLGLAVNASYAAQLVGSSNRTIFYTPAPGVVLGKWHVLGVEYTDTLFNWGSARKAIGQVSLNDITDVTITSPAIPSFLAYNGAGWIDYVPVLNNISDVNTSGDKTNYFLGYDGSNWVPRSSINSLVADSLLLIGALTKTGTTGIGFAKNSTIASTQTGSSSSLKTMFYPPATGRGVVIVSWNNGLVEMYDTLFNEGKNLEDDLLYPAISVLGSGTDSVTVTIKSKQIDGSTKTKVALVTWWLSTTSYGDPQDNALTQSVTTGNNIDPETADVTKVNRSITDTNGTLEMLLVGGTGNSTSFTIHAEIQGVVYKNTFLLQIGIL